MPSLFDLEGLTAFSPILLQAGRIVNINTTTHSYDVVTDNGYQMKDLPIMYPYVSNEKGQGINYIPEVGTRCLVCNTINGEDFIMGFIIPVGTGSAVVTNEVDQKNLDSYQGRSGNRSSDLLPGDVELRTVDGNSVRVLTGGLVEIVSAEGQCLTKYIPKAGENLIFTKSDIIEHVLGSGDLLWSTDNTNRTGSLEFNLKSNIDLDEPDVTIKMGSAASDGGLDIVVGAQGTQAILTFNEDGEVSIECQKVTVTAEKDATIDCKNANIRASSQVRVTAGLINLN